MTTGRGRGKERDQLADDFDGEPGASWRAAGETTEPTAPIEREPDPTRPIERREIAPAEIRTEELPPEPAIETRELPPAPAVAQTGGTENPGRVAFWDDRNEGYRIRSLMGDARGGGLPTREELVTQAREAGIRRKYHNTPDFWVDQMDYPACTAAALLHFRANGPVRPGRAGLRALPGFLDLYREIQSQDRAEGRHYPEGATALALAKVAQRRGWIGEYRWGTTAAELFAAVLVGPVLIGINWYEGMNRPDENGLIRPTGRLVGGHEILVNGVNLERGVYRLQQSWGRQHGRTGFVELTFADAESLISESGDVLLARELPDEGSPRRSIHPDGGEGGDADRA